MHRNTTRPAGAGLQSGVSYRSRHSADLETPLRLRKIAGRVVFFDCQGSNTATKHHPKHRKEAAGWCFSLYMPISGVFSLQKIK